MSAQQVLFVDTRMTEKESYLAEQTVKHYEITMNSHRSNTSEFDNRSQGQLQETIQPEFKSILVQWRNEIFDEVRNTMNDLNTKFQYSKETMDFIKQHLKANAQSLNEIEEKLADYDRKIGVGNISKESGDKNVGTSSTNQNPETENKEKLELDQQPGSKINTEMIEQLTKEFEKYKLLQAEDSRNKLKQFENELSETIEGKLKQIADNLSSKVETVENHIKGLKNPEDLQIESLKVVIESKLQESNQNLKNQILSLQKMIESISKEDHDKPTLNVKDKVEITTNIQQQDLLVLISKTEQNLKETQEYFEKKTYQFEERYHAQFEDVYSKLRGYSDGFQKLAHRVDTIKSDNETSFVVKIDSLSKEILELVKTRTSMQFEITKIAQNLEELKHLTTNSITDLQKKPSGDSLNDSRIKRLEELVDSLAKTVEGLRHNTSNLTNSPGSDSTSATTDRYRLDSLLQGQSIRPINQQYYVSETINSKYEDSCSRTYQVPWNQNANSALVYSSPEKYTTGERRLDENRPFDRNSNPNKSFLNESPSTGSGLNRPIFNDVGGVYQRNKSPSPERRAEPFANTRYGDSGYIVQEKKRETSNASPERTLDKSERQMGIRTNNDLSPYSLQDKQDNYPKPRTSARIESPIIESTRIQSPRNDLNTQKISSPDAFPHQNEEEEEEMVYQFDENGFLMDEDGNYILDEQGQMIKLDQEHIERLRASNLLEEEN